MKPSARIETAVTIWGHLMKVPLPMDKFCGDYFRNNRFIGSKDRADIAARLYDMMRHYARIGWWMDRTGLDRGNPRHWVLTHLAREGAYGAGQIRDIFCGEKYAPAALDAAEDKALDALIATTAGKDFTHPDMPESVALECPDWAYAGLKSALGPRFAEEMAAMQEQAALHVRVNTMKIAPEKARASLSRDGIAAEDGAFVPTALRLPPSVYLSQTEAFKKGWVEIQDEGSQAIAALCAAAPGMQVLDYCAGGGGKTLALADAMAGKGRIVAMDLDAKRLERGRKRYVKAGIHNVEVRPLSEDQHRKWLRRQKDKFDCVLVDAPCSGAGTWRRNPDLRWRSGAPALAELTQVQADILDRTAAYVKPGGALVYATCSMLPEENENQIAAFLAAHPDFKIAPVADIAPDLAKAANLNGPYLALSPARHGTDGFFACRLVKSA